LTTDSHATTTHYNAVDPRSIYIFLNEKKNDLSDKVELFKEAIPVLNELKLFKGVVPQIQYYEGRDSLELFFYNIAHADYSYSIFSIEDLLKHIYFDIDELYTKLSNDTVK
jgi:hypothetical protein